MLQYQPKLNQICPSAYGVDATSIRIGKSLVWCVGGGGGITEKYLFRQKYVCVCNFAKS